MDTQGLPKRSAMAIDKLEPAKYQGVFFIEHPTRKWTPPGKKTPKPDRQFILTYVVAGKKYRGVFGWESQGHTEMSAANKIEFFKENAASGGAVCLRDEKVASTEALKANQKKLSIEAVKNTTLGEYFNGDYLDAANANKKEATVVSEEALFKKWIEPTMGKIPIKDILPLDFQRLKNKVLKGDRCIDDKGKVFYVTKSPRTVHYCASIVIQVWNMAFDNKVVSVQPPRRKTLNLPMIDNERTRAFTPEQAKKYFEHMDVRSKQWSDITRASLFAGLRASEVFKLEVKDFDEGRGLLFLKSPKKAKSQKIALNDTAFDLFKGLKKSHKTGKGLFFLDTNDNQIVSVSNTVQAAITELGFNAEVTDKRDKLTFHSWRHTYATWLIDSGTDIYTVSQLLRHSTLAMTNRYIHKKDEALRQAARGIDNVFNDKPEEDNSETGTS